VGGEREGGGATAVGCAARRGERSWRFAGVVTTVRRRPRAARRPTKSRSGSAWPCAGKGMTSTCGVAPGVGAASMAGACVAERRMPGGETGETARRGCRFHRR
jgi:hypothetical protein